MPAPPAAAPPIRPSTPSASDVSAASVTAGAEAASTPDPTPLGGPGRETRRPAPRGGPGGKPRKFVGNRGGPPGVGHRGGGAEGAGGGAGGGPPPFQPAQGRAARPSGNQRERRGRAPDTAGEEVGGDAPD